MPPPPKDFLKLLAGERHWLAGYTLDNIHSWLTEEQFRIHERRGSRWFCAVVSAGFAIFAAHRLFARPDHQVGSFFLLLFSVAASGVFSTLALSERQRLKELKVAMGAIDEARAARVETGD